MGANVESIDLREMESVISDYIFEKKGQRVKVNVLKGFERIRPPHPAILLANIQIGKALSAYSYIMSVQK